MAFSIIGTEERESPSVNQQFAGYTLIRLIGQGGYARVYLGLSHDLQTHVALKLLNLSLADAREMERFQAEARLLARLRHRHIVRALDFGWQGTTPFLAMEYAPGGDLGHYFPAAGALPLRTILPVVEQAASALQYLHHLGLVHCDVKPENFLVGPSGDLWLSDFGIATTAVSNRQFRAHDLVGSFDYMAPERITGNPLAASDQYALAVMVYQWLCGRPPFLGTTTQICLHHLQTPPPPLRDFVPSLSPHVERVVRRALAKNPQQRFPHVLQFAQALRRAGCR